MPRTDPWRGWEQPTLAGHDCRPDWESSRTEPPPRPVRDGPVEALTLVSDGDCSPQCMVAPPSDRHVCHCTCRGMYHGILAHTQVTAAALETLHAP